MPNEKAPKVIDRSKDDGTHDAAADAGAPTDPKATNAPGSTGSTGLATDGKASGDRVSDGTDHAEPPVNHPVDVVNAPSGDAGNAVREATNDNAASPHTGDVDAAVQEAKKDEASIKSLEAEAERLANAASDPGPTPSEIASAQARAADARQAARGH